MEVENMEENKIGEEHKISKKHAIGNSTEHYTEHQQHKKERAVTKAMLVLMAISALLLVFNQFQINALSGMMGSGFSSSVTNLKIGKNSGKELANINLEELKSTGHTIAAVFPVEDIQTQEDAMAILFPTGTPDYGSELEVSFDDPVGSLAKLSRMYPSLRAEVMQNNPEGWQRFMNLASKPIGISCEYCCGVGSIGIRSDGSSACGCQHNPALLAIALYLSAYTDYSDGEILREVMKWKTLFFPQKMIELGMTVAGGDTSSLDKLPGMVGGC